MARRSNRDSGGEAPVRYRSVNALQQALATEVFSYATDAYKAAGRALGTLVELTTFYTLCAWNLRDHTMIERSVPEFGNDAITHNVEFSLHPIANTGRGRISPLVKPLTDAKIIQAMPDLSITRRIHSQLMDTRDRLRNACVIAETKTGRLVANVDSIGANKCDITVAELMTKPFAIFECKRVGVEQGMNKGPQTIEKAKQGAYVARAVSSLQKVRLRDGTFNGVLEKANQELYIAPYAKLLREIIDGNAEDMLSDFMLTVGVVSNHGNWFTAATQNKEMRVLAQSYDWLLFLTDDGLAQFIEKLILRPAKELAPARDAFLASYSGRSGSNRFTKVKIDVAADQSLRAYFTEHEDEIESWFNVITPENKTITALRTDLRRLAAKDWARIHRNDA